MSACSNSDLNKDLDQFLKSNSEYTISHKINYHRSISPALLKNRFEVLIKKKLLYADTIFHKDGTTSYYLHPTVISKNQLIKKTQNTLTFRAYDLEYLHIDSITSSSDNTFYNVHSQFNRIAPSSLFLNDPYNLSRDKTVSEKTGRTLKVKKNMLGLTIESSSLTNDTLIKH